MATHANKKQTRNKNKTKTYGGKKNKTEGGKRKTRKMSKGASNWQQQVMKVYKEMKAKDKNVKLGDAMKRCSELKKKGQL
jgi:hypothetical protein